MATKKITVNHEWQQITDGTQTVLVQIFGYSEVCDSPVKPGNDQAAHSFSDTTLNVTPPTVMWLRSPWLGSKVHIVIS